MSNDYVNFQQNYNTLSAKVNLNNTKIEDFKQFTQLVDIKTKMFEHHIRELKEDRDTSQFTHKVVDRLKKLEDTFKADQSARAQELMVFKREIKEKIITGEDAYRISYNVSVDLAKNVFNWDKHNQLYCLSKNQFATKAKQMVALVTDNFQGATPAPFCKKLIKVFDKLVQKQQEESVGMNLKEKWQDFPIFQREYEEYLRVN